MLKKLKVACRGRKGKQRPHLYSQGITMTIKIKLFGKPDEEFILSREQEKIVYDLCTQLSFLYERQMNEVE